MHGGRGDGSIGGIGSDNYVDSTRAILEAREELDELKGAVEAARGEVGSRTFRFGSRPFGNVPPPLCSLFVQVLIVPFELSSSDSVD